MQIENRGGRGSTLRVIAQMQEGDLTYDAYDLMGSDATMPFAVASCADVVILGLSLTSPIWIGDLANLDPSLNPELRSALMDLAERLEVSQAGRLLGADDEADLRLPSALAFLPLRTPGGEVIGGILALYDHVHPFSIAERQVHQMLTDLGGVVLCQQQRYAEAVRRAERASVLSSVRERLWRAEDMETILRTTAVELGRALDVDTVAVEATPGDRPVDEDGLTL